MSVIESVVRSKIEGQDPSHAIEGLLEDFPDELHERLYGEIESMSDGSARDYLINKLVARREANTRRVESLSGEIPVIKTCPRAIQASIERSKEDSREGVIGYGNNGEIIPSVANPEACYKLLFIDRARELGSDVVREAVLQNQSYETVVGREDCAQIPEVICFVDHKDVKAIKMERIKGSSLLSVLNGASELPSNFDSDSFFAKLNRTAELLNQKRIHHCDLAGNAGNVMIDEKGNPWLIDFGSAVKSVETSDDGRSYQLFPGARYYRSTDVGAIKDMKQRLSAHIASLGD